jgi:hypothetical protein
MELVEGSDQARPHIARIIAAERYSHDIEAGPIVQLEELRHQERRGVPIEIR